MKEAMQVIGERRWLPVEGGRLWMGVQIHDVKQSYGRLRYQVAPLEGFGVT